MLQIYCGQTSGHTLNPKVRCSYISSSLKKILQHHWTMKYRSQGPTFIFRSKHPVILTHNPKVGCSYISLQDKAKSLDHEIHVIVTYILRSHIRSYGLVIPKYDVHTSNSLQYMAKSWDREIWVMLTFTSMTHKSLLQG